MNVRSVLGRTLAAARSAGRAAVAARAIRSVAAVAIAAAIGGGCDVESPPRGPEATCAKSCESRSPRCSKSECARGCNLVLDRLAEHEGDRVIACVSRGPAPCDDRLWARCATRIGPYADGGPPAPPPPSDDLDDLE